MHWDSQLWTFSNFDRDTFALFYSYIIFHLQLPKIDDPRELWRKVEDFAQKYKKDNPGPSKSDWTQHTCTWNGLSVKREWKDSYCVPVLVEVWCWRENGRSFTLYLYWLKSAWPECLKWRNCVWWSGCNEQLIFWGDGGGLGGRHLYIFRQRKHGTSGVLFFLWHGIRFTVFASILMDAFLILS